MDAGGSEDDEGPDTADKKDAPKLTAKRSPTQNCNARGHNKQAVSNAACNAASPQSFPHILYLPIPL
jgi:hypothetical protein